MRIRTDIRVSTCFSLVCASKMGIDYYEVKVDLQKGVLRFREKMTILTVLVSSNSCFHPIVVTW